MGFVRMSGWSTGIVAILAGCASYPPERVERDRAVLEALKPCKERYAERLYNPNMMSVEQNGTVRYWYRDGNVSASSDIDRCISETLKGVKVGPFALGRSAKGVPASVPLMAAGKELLVTVRVNGVPGTMVISTSSALTMVGPDYAKRAGLHLVAQSPSARAVIGGKNVVLPFVRAKTVELGDASVEALDIALHETFPGRSLDGLLGNSFLGNFKLNIDRRNLRLTLEPSTRS